MPVIFKIDFYCTYSTRSRVAIFRKKAATIEKVTVRLPANNVVIRP